MTKRCQFIDKKAFLSRDNNLEASLSGRGKRLIISQKNGMHRKYTLLCTAEVVRSIRSTNSLHKPPSLTVSIEKVLPLSGDRLPLPVDRG